VDIIFKSRHTEVPERFRKHATAKLSKIGKLDHRAVRIDVEISAERNPRQAGRKERVELTVRSRGPAIRAEAAAEDRFAALDLALAKLDARLRRALDRRKARHGAHSAVRVTDLPESDHGAAVELPEVRPGGATEAGTQPAAQPSGLPGEGELPADAEGVVQIEMQGDGPLVVREKFHAAVPMTIDQALFEMELVGHDFFLFTDEKSSMPSVVYRRRGYQYGVIRLVEDPDAGSGTLADKNGSAAFARNARGQVRQSADTAGR
jgi:ribosomal subunit interface protein